MYLPVLDIFVNCVSDTFACVGEKFTCVTYLPVLDIFVACVGETISTCPGLTFTY